MTDAPLRIWTHRLGLYIVTGPENYHPRPTEYHLHTREALAQSPIVQAMIAEAVGAEAQKRRDRAAYENMWASRGTE
jgi:hypothetical protein